MKSLSKNLVAGSKHGFSLVTLAIVATILSGCGEKGKSTQVAAKINDEDITISQVNSALASVPVVPGKTAEEAKHEVLDNLIVQNLADQQAVKMKLDRKPAVMQAIESAKNTILARAYMDPIIAAIPKPTQEDVHKFYVEHPALFSNRHIFNIRELEVASKPELAASIREMVSKGDSLDTIAAWLKSKDIPSSIQSGVKPAEQLPLEVLTSLEKLAVGKSLVIELSKTISVLQVVDSKLQAVAETAASPFIQDYLMNTRKKEALDQEIKSLKAAAKIQLYGEFQSGVQATASMAKEATAEVPAKKSEATSTPDVAKGMGLK
jgi:EpsD family peptidyl-prolyl cis-trans isomerase